MDNNKPQGLITDEHKRDAYQALDDIKEIIAHPDTDDLAYIRMRVKEMLVNVIDALT